MKIMMADGKEVSTAGQSPTYIATSASDREKKGVQKKYVIAGISAVLVIGLIITGILVGMHIFSEAQKDIVRFSMQFKGNSGEDVKQDVESDPYDNVVTYTLSKPGQDSVVVNDFNKGMQIVRMSTSEGVNCYVSALNRTNAMDPSRITGPETKNDKTESTEQSFIVADEPVSDRTFLTKKALDVCKGVSLYWVYRNCGEKIADNSTAIRTKRATYGYSWNGLQCRSGCCTSWCACSVSSSDYYSGGRHYCNFYARTGTCCARVGWYFCSRVFYGSGPCY